MKRSFPAKVTAGFAAAILAALTSGGISLRAIAARNASAEQMTRTLQARSSILHILSVMRDAEAGQRGYLLTRDSRYLDSYHAALVEIGPALDRARELLEHDPAQRRQIGELAPLVQQRLDELKRGLELPQDLRSPSGPPTNQASGVDLMHAISERLEAMARIEEGTLALRESAWDSGVMVSNAALVLSALLLLVLILAAAKLVSQDRKERERQVEERQHTLELQQQLMGVVGHDLRNPLSAIMTSAEILVRAPDFPERRRPGALRILTSARRMQRIIRDLLDYTRLRVGVSIPVSPRPTDLSEVCHRVVEELEAENPGRRVQCRHDGEVTVMLDPDRMEQVLSNLVANALRYSPAGTPVQVSALERDGRIAIEVHNEGEPIPAELLPHIFDPFRRGQQEGQGATSGLGLGLFIVRHIVEAHGGEVAVASKNGEGTTFCVRLPRRAAQVRSSSGAGLGRGAQQSEAGSLPASPA